MCALCSVQFVQLVCSLCSLCNLCSLCAPCNSCCDAVMCIWCLHCAVLSCLCSLRAVCNLYSLCSVQFVQFVQLLLNFPAFCRRECFSLTEGSGLRCKCFFTALSAWCAPIFIFFLPEQLSNIYGPCGEYVANSLGAVVTVECKEKLRQLKDAVVREFTPKSFGFLVLTAFVHFNWMKPTGSQLTLQWKV